MTFMVKAHYWKVVPKNEYRPDGRYHMGSRWLMKNHWDDQFETLREAEAAVKADAERFAKNCNGGKDEYSTYEIFNLLREETADSRTDI